MIWFFALLGVFALLAFVFVRPLMLPAQPWEPVSTSKAVVVLEGQREQVMRKLKDLSNEREAGSIEEAEYEELRSSLVTEAALLKRRIEALETGNTQSEVTS